MTDQPTPSDPRPAATGSADRAPSVEPGAEQAVRPPATPEAASDGHPAAVTPMHVPMLKVVEVGIALWAVALVVTLVVPALHEGDRSWWPWACVSGIVLGAVGWTYVRRGRGNATDAA